MDLSTAYAIAEIIAAALAAIGIGIGIGRTVGRSTFGRDAYAQAVELIDQQNRKITILQEDAKTTAEIYESKHKEQAKRIDGLTTEIQIIKDLPLKQLKEDYHKIADTLVLQTGILKAIQEVLANISASSGAVVNIHEAKT